MKARPVYFVKYYDKGSTYMGGEMMREGLAALGIESASVHAREARGIRDSILVLIKTSRWYDLAWFRSRGNRLVLDVQDQVVFKRRIKNRSFYHGLLFRSRAALRDFGSGRALSRVIYHPWDPRYAPNRLGLRALRIGYFGIPRSFPLWGRVPGLDCIGEDWFGAALDYNCHVSVRTGKREHLYKPGTKVSTAAACDAVLLTVRDESSLEMLGEDYPYYGEGGLEGILAMMDRARSTFGGADWDRALNRLREVRERTRMDRIAREYADFFRDLG